MLVAIRMASRDAEHAVAADRCAREILAFLTHFGGALAAAERQAVRRPGRVGDNPCLMVMSRSRFWNARRATSVVPVLVVLAWCDGSSCRVPVVPGVIVCL